jgi:hypothetical protein
MMDEAQIVKALADSDPVYAATVSPPVVGTPEGLSRSYVRRCSLCRRESGHNEENVRHEANCPWIAARLFLKEENK